MEKMALLGLIAAPLAGSMIGSNLAFSALPSINEAVDAANYRKYADPSQLNKINDLPTVFKNNPRALKYMGAGLGAGLGGLAAYSAYKNDSPLLLPSLGAAGGAALGTAFGMRDTVGTAFDMMARKKLPPASIINNPMFSRLGKPALGALAGGLGGYLLHKAIAD